MDVKYPETIDLQKPMSSDFINMLKQDRYNALSGVKKEKVKVKKNFYDINEIQNKMAERAKKGKKSLKVKRKMIRKGEINLLMDLGASVTKHKPKNKLLRMLSSLFRQQKLKISWDFQ